MAQTSAKRVLVLQGGGALGAYQAGAFEALAKTQFEPDWIAGISIGAINAAIIAGNAPKDRLPRLVEFWTRVSAPLPFRPFAETGFARTIFNETNAALIATWGVPDFFMPRVPPTEFLPSNDPTTLSIYDTAPLRQTLLDLVDFDLINHKGSMRLSVGAVDVATGDMTYFDNRCDTFTPEHIMASAALPPGFPAVKVGNAYYWDGGIASNTPLDKVLEQQGGDDLLIFQIDLFSARGSLPTTLLATNEREKDIRYSSRSRQSVKKNKHLLNKRSDALRDLLARLPDDLKNDPAVKILGEEEREPKVTVIQLIYRSRPSESSSKDYNFARANKDEHWDAGRADIAEALGNTGWMDGPPPGKTMMVHRIGATP